MCKKLYFIGIEQLGNRNHTGAGSFGPLPSSFLAPKAWRSPAPMGPSYLLAPGEASTLTKNRNLLKGFQSMQRVTRKAGEPSSENRQKKGR